MPIGRGDCVMSKQHLLSCAATIVLLLLNTVPAQEQEMVELTRGNWSVEYEGNVMEVQGIERCAEYQRYFENSTRPRGPKLVAPRESIVIDIPDGL